MSRSVFLLGLLLLLTAGLNAQTATITGTISGNDQVLPFATGYTDGARPLFTSLLGVCGREQKRV